jgi:outer membrane lipoprotein carrier protein
MQVSRGTVKVKKPGRMRWDYREPLEKHFLLDGKVMWMHIPADNQVTVNKSFASDQLSAAVTFLWGKGKLADEFDIRSAQRKDLEGPVLELVPKKGAAQFQKLYFSVDPATGRVRASIVVDPQGNENRMLFTDARVNAGIADSEFEFKPPKGTAVQEL